MLRSVRFSTVFIFFVLRDWAPYLGHVSTYADTCVNQTLQDSDIDKSYGCKETWLCTNITSTGGNITSYELKVDWKYCWDIDGLNDTIQIEIVDVRLRANCKDVISLYEILEMGNDTTLQEDTCVRPEQKYNATRFLVMLTTDDNINPSLTDTGFTATYWKVAVTTTTPDSKPRTTPYTSTNHVTARPSETTNIAGNTGSTPYLTPTLPNDEKSEPSTETEGGQGSIVPTSYSTSSLSQVTNLGGNAFNKGSPGAVVYVIPILLLIGLLTAGLIIFLRKRRRGLVDKESSSPRSFTNTTYSQDHSLATPGAKGHLQGDDVVYNSAYASSNGIKPSTNSDPHEGQVYNTAYQSVDDKGQSSQDVNNQPEYNYIDTEILGGESAYNVAYEGFDGKKANGNLLSDSSEAGQSSHVKGSDAEYNYIAPEKLEEDSTYNVAYGGFTEDKTDNNAADDPAYLEIKDGDEEPGNKYYTLEPR